MSVSKLLVIEPRDEELTWNERLAGVLECALAGVSCVWVRTAEELERYLAGEQAAAGAVTPDTVTPDTVAPDAVTPDTVIPDAGAGPDEHRRLLFALSLGEHGVNLEYYRMLRYLREHRSERLLDCYTGGLIVDGDSELYTKYAAKELVFTANCAGCTFVGRPLVEGTRTLSNFAIVAQNMDTDYPTAYRNSARQLVEEILAFERPVIEKPELLALHASSHVTSNTFALWNGVKERLEDIAVTEIGLRNGTLSDCSGCPYKMCLHFGEKGSCFYGGVMVEDVYPAVRRANAIVLLCPNYNDALSANLTAFINRLTALFRTVRFYDKALFAIVVSGYSGSDIVAGQLIAALNMNKTFYLPGRFAMMETANNAGTAVKLPGIDERIAAFAENINRTLTGPCNHRP